MGTDRSRKLVLSAVAGLMAAIAGCGTGSGTPRAATPAADEEETDKNACGGGRGHACGAETPPAKKTGSTAQATDAPVER